MEVLARNVKNEVSAYTKSMSAREAADTIDYVIEELQVMLHDLERQARRDEQL